MASNPLFEQLRAIFPGMPEHDLPRFASALTRPGPYAPGPDAQPREGVAHGVLESTRFTRANGAYPGIERVVKVYVPAPSSTGRPACLMVFQDGARYLGPEANAATVLDN